MICTIEVTDRVHVEVENLEPDLIELRIKEFLPSGGPLNWQSKGVRMFPSHAESIIEAIQTVVTMAKNMVPDASKSTS